MKKGKTLSLLALIVFLLAGCNQTPDGTSSPVVVSESGTDSLEEIAYTWWEDKLYRSPETGDLLYANIRDNNIAFSSAKTSFTVITDTPEYGEDNDNGKFIRYTYELNLEGGQNDFHQFMSVLYYADLDRAIIFGSGDGGDFDDYYEYYKARPSSSTETPDWVVQPETQEPTPDFYEGEQFECFDTLSGDDIILTVRVLLDSEINTYMYKAELSNGVEFWFYEVNQDSGEYDIEVAAGEYSGRLTHTPNSSELILHTEGYALNDYDGSYTGLP